MTFLIVGLGLLIALPAAAQQGVVPQAAQPPKPGVEIKSTAPVGVERPARVVAPPLHYETTRPPDVEFYTEGSTRVEHDPAFIEPFAAQYETASGSGRYGLSGWTAPNAPIGSESTLKREVSGWFAIGFSVTWDGPPAPKSRPPR
jgi:hypothetical protein